MSRAIWPAGALALLFVLAGCAREPILTSRDDWYDANVAVCYSAAHSTREQVAGLAAAQCPAGRHGLLLVAEDVAVNDCPILMRRRALFKCVSPDTPGTVYP